MKNGEASKSMTVKLPPLAGIILRQKKIKSTNYTE
jgi:hypothetical protein